MTYKPKFTDPRIRSTATKALNFVELYVSKSKPSWISRAQMYAHLGDTSKPLGRYLLNLLLITNNNYNMNTGECKKYVRNTAGIEELKCLLGLEQHTPALNSELLEQIESGDFEYTEKSSRIYNPVQCIPRDIRGPLLANYGYRHNYDIEAAAPTLLLQYAQQINPDFVAPALTNYINNRTQVRNQIAAECEINPNNVKFIINALLNGGCISTYRENKILVELNYDYDAIRRLQHNSVIAKIKQDISSMWKVLKQTFPVRTIITRSGKEQCARLSSRDKSGLYRDLESQCRGVITRYLRSKRTKFLWEHDGWRCDKAVDTQELCSKVRQQTGFVILLDWGVYE